jgi:hypothetical protein
MSKIYTFECYPMPWTEFGLGIKNIGNQELIISLELDSNDIRDIINMLHWAWDNEYFDINFSEKRYSQLLKEKIPSLYERVHQLVHIEFCNRYPNSCHIEGFGDYEIFPPDEIFDAAFECYPKRKERFGI